MRAPPESKPSPAGAAPSPGLSSGSAAPPVVEGTPPVATAPVVEDGGALGEGEMARSAFLAALREDVARMVDEEMAGTPFSGRGCPWLDHYLDQGRQAPLRTLQATLRRYAGADARTAAELRAAVVARARRGVRAWRESGAPPTLPGVPLPTGIAWKAAAPGDGSPTDAANALMRLGPGAPLDPTTRARLERGLGAALGPVRVHTGPEAAAIAAGRGAEAFAVGGHVGFAAGRYRPGTPEGDALLAHELAHTLQQEPGATGTPREAEADAAAVAAVRTLHGRGAATPVRLGRAGLALSSCEPPEAGREPTDAEREKLAEYDVLLALLERQKVEEREKSAGIYETVEGHVQPGAAGTAQLDELAARILDIQTQLDALIAAMRWEKSSLEGSLTLAVPGEPIVFYRSRYGPPRWLPERYAGFQREVDTSGAGQMGHLAAERYHAARKRGDSATSAVFTVMGWTVGDLTGFTNLYEAIGGERAVTGEPLATGERVMRGVLGVIQVGSLVASGGPRVAEWARGIKVPEVRVLAPSGPQGVPMVVLVGGRVAPLVLTQAEVATLAAAGLGNLTLAMAAIPGGGGRPVPGLTNSSYGPARGGGGSPTARAYAERATGNKEAVYIDDVEFDGFDPQTRTLVDAKWSRGAGSMYDVSGTDSFTRNVKIPQILDQARRQLGVLGRSGATGIEWRVSDPGIAAQLQRLFAKNSIAITVRHVP